MSRNRTCDEPLTEKSDPAIHSQRTMELLGTHGTHNAQKQGPQEEQ
jgi:hypothetical protein